MEQHPRHRQTDRDDGPPSGSGPRSARRAVLQMIRKRGQLLSPLADQMAKVAATARECLNCGNIGTEDICDICRSEKRATGEICVVQDVSDLWAMERGAAFGGRYHVLGGTLSALDDIGPEDIRIPQLVARIESEQISRGDPRAQCHCRWADDGTLHRGSFGRAGAHHLAGPRGADRRGIGLSGRRHNFRRAQCP